VQFQDGEFFCSLAELRVRYKNFLMLAYAPTSVVLCLPINVDVKFATSGTVSTRPMLKHWAPPLCAGAKGKVKKKPTGNNVG
jgi:hypothetical protein